MEQGREEAARGEASASQARWGGAAADEFRADLDAMMRVVWWAVGLTLAVGVIAHRARLVMMHEPTVVGLAAAIQLNAVCAAWLARRVKHPIGLYFAVHFLNILLISVIVHYCGGIYFFSAPLLYTLVVANGGIAGFVPAHVLALASWVAYGTVVTAEVTGFWPPFVEPGIPRVWVEPGAWPAAIAFMAAVLHASARYAECLGGVLRARRRDVEQERRRVQAEIAERLQALDAAERARAENDALRRRSARYRSLVHIVTHDLKNPINAIYLTAELLLTRPGSDLAPATRDAIERIRRMAEATEAKIFDLTNLSRIVSTPEKRGWIDLNGLVRESLAELHGLIETKGIHLEVGCLPNVWGEREKLGHAVRNLLSNAVKYVHSEGGWVRVSGDVADGCARFAVEDNGIGIPEAYHERIFEVFARVPEAEQDADAHLAHGTGVGLALVKRIVESHHGTVSVRSAPGCGSRFEIRLPVLSEASDERPGGEPASTEALGATPHR